jgi:hypothetical protein
MKSLEEIKNKIKTIESDSRYIAGIKRPANVNVNAPLALIQMGISGELNALKWVIEEK